MISGFKKFTKCMQKCIWISAFSICVLAIAGCSSSVSSRIEFDHQPYEPIINAETLIIEVISVNNALRSETVIENAIDYYRPYVAGEIKILDCNYVTLDLGEDNAISRQQLNEIINPRENFGPTWISIVICPDMDFFSKKGFFSAAAPKDRLDLVRQCIIINAKTCNKQASSIPFVSSERLTSLVILHELCHALRVPAGKHHMKKGNEGHCSNPNCILYPAIDFNSALSAILHLGPPTGLCKQCREEVFAVQKNNCAKNMSEAVKR